MKKIKKFLTNKRKLKCFGCGRHEKEVSAEVELYFCNHCIVNNGNYGRYQSGLEMVKPITNLKPNDIVLDASGKPYYILAKSYIAGEDTYYFCEQLYGKHDIVELGDFCFYKKTGKREVNKINKTVDNGGSFSEFTVNFGSKNSCLNCKFVNKNTNTCDKKGLSLLDEKIDPNTCEFYK